MQNMSFFDSFLSCPPSFMEAGVIVDEVSVAVAMLAMPVGVVLAVCGYRLSRITFFLCGFMSGMLITFAIIRDQIDYQQLPFEGAVGIAVAGGFVLGLLSLGLQVLGLFVVGMDAAFLLCSASIGIVAHFLTIEERFQRAAAGTGSIVMFSSPFPSRWLPVGVMVLACLLGGLLSLLKPKHLLMIASSLVGSAIIMLTFGYFLEGKNPLRPARFVAASIIGTRYMQIHYGRYLFGYQPSSPLTDRRAYHSLGSVSEGLFSVNSFTINTVNSRSLHSTSTETVVTPLPEKEPVPTFLCWSDFVLVACWLITASLFAIIQYACFNTLNETRRRSKHRSKKCRSHSSSHKNGTKKKPSAPENNRTVSMPVHLDHYLAVQRSSNDLPPYSQAALAAPRENSDANVQSWFSRVQEITNNSPPSRPVNLSVRNVPADEHRFAAMPLRSNQVNSVMSSNQYIATAASASVIFANANKQVIPSSKQESQQMHFSPVISGAPGHLMRMRRSMGDQLSRDFISNCVASRIPDHPGIHC